MDTVSAFIAIVGRPNVGKSSLLNALVGKKVAIVSDKPQTTRTRIMGVVTRDTTQLVFLDTPGNHKPRTRLGDFMVRSIGEAVSGVDVGLLVTEPRTTIREEEQALLEQLQKKKLPVILAINKIDTVSDKAQLLSCIAAWQQQMDFAAIVPVSAVTGDGLEDLLAELNKYTFPSPHFFPADASSDQTEQAIASEVIREKMLQLLRQEIPHGMPGLASRWSIGALARISKYKDGWEHPENLAVLKKAGRDLYYRLRKKYPVKRDIGR